jgi:hypothetical protein
VLAQQVNKEMDVGASAMEMVACFDNTGILAFLVGFIALNNFFLCHFLTQKVTPPRRAGKKLWAPVFTSNRCCLLLDNYLWAIGFLVLLQT